MNPRPTDTLLYVHRMDINMDTEGSPVPNFKNQHFKASPTKQLPISVSAIRLQ